MRLWPSRRQKSEKIRQLDWLAGQTTEFASYTPAPRIMQCPVKHSMHSTFKQIQTQPIAILKNYKSNSD